MDTAKGGGQRVVIQTVFFCKTDEREFSCSGSSKTIHREGAYELSATQLGPMYQHSTTSSAQTLLRLCVEVAVTFATVPVVSMVIQGFFSLPRKRRRREWEC